MLTNITIYGLLTVGDVVIDPLGSDLEDFAILRFRQAWNCIDKLARITVARLDDPTDILTLSYHQFKDWCVQAQLCYLGASEADYYSNLARQPDLCNLITELARLMAIVRKRGELDAADERTADTLYALEAARLELLHAFED